MNVLKLCLPLLFAPSLALAIDCKVLHSDQFYAEFEEEVFISCLEQEAPTFFATKKHRGQTVLHRVIRSDLDPTILDDLLYFLHKASEVEPVNQTQDLTVLQQALEEKDSSGRTALQVAVNDAPHSETLVSLVSWGGDPNILIGDDFLVDVVLKKREPDVEIATLLTALGGLNGLWEFEKLSLDALALVSPDDFRLRYRDKKLSIAPITNMATDAECLANLQAGTIQNLYPEQWNYCSRFILSDAPLKGDADGNTPLHLGVMNGLGVDFIDSFFIPFLKDQDQIETVLSVRNIQGRSALDVAAQHAVDPRVITRLIAWGADPNLGLEPAQKKGLLGKIPSRNSKKHTSRPIHHAAKRTDDHRLMILASLLAGGAEASYQDEKGRTPLHNLFFSRDVADKAELFSLQLLLWNSTKGKLFGLAGATLVEPKDNQGATAFARALNKSGEPLFLEEFLLFGANPLETDDRGWSPVLRYAATGEDADTFTALLKHSKVKKMCIHRVDGASIPMLLEKNQKLKAGTNSDGEHPIQVFQDLCPGN